MLYQKLGSEEYQNINQIKIKRI